jgi:hypothetical protein
MRSTLLVAGLCVLGTSVLALRPPVLALYQAQRPFEEVAAGYAIRNEQERAALRLSVKRG